LKLWNTDIRQVLFWCLLYVRHGFDKLKQTYLITYPTGKIYIGKDAFGSHRYFGSPDMDVVNDRLKNLPEAIRKDYTSIPLEHPKRLNELIEVKSEP